MLELTGWVTPFTTKRSLSEAMAAIISRLPSKRWHANLLLPTHFGAWPQAECRQSLPPDMLVGSPEDVAAIRAQVEGAGLGFGAWGVPVAVHDDKRAPGVEIPKLAAAFARAAGYYSANFEPEAFWLPGDDPAEIDAWWAMFWDEPGMSELDGCVSATVIPNQWGLNAFKRSLPNLAGGCNALALEVYGGLQTAAQYPTLWPDGGFAAIRKTGVDANLIPILAAENVDSEIALARRLGQGNVQFWCI